MPKSRFSADIEAEFAAAADTTRDSFRRMASVIKSAQMAWVQGQCEPALRIMELLDLDSADAERVYDDMDRRFPDEWRRVAGRLWK